jgi:hypothetical protein
MPSPSRLLLVTASLLPGPRAVTADELPEATNEIESLTIEQAQRLVTEFKGSLFLNGLTTLSDEATKALAQHKGDVLDLNGLTTFSADAAKALVESKNWNGHLSGITAFASPDSVAIAQALATRKGPLALPNRKKISPRTLSALIEKTDFEIPLVETLELIPEPGRGLCDPGLVGGTAEAAPGKAESLARTDFEYGGVATCRFMKPRTPSPRTADPRKTLMNRRFSVG